jgi:phosphoesterase RecJ-like protein
LKVNKKYNISFSVLPYEDLNNIIKDHDYLNGDVFGDIAGFLSSLSETDIIMVLREEEPGRIKGSLRVGASRPGIKADVNKLASIFGGGGHKKASGFFIKGNIIKEGSNFKIV